MSYLVDDGVLAPPSGLTSFRCREKRQPCYSWCLGWLIPTVLILSQDGIWSKSYMQSICRPVSRIHNFHCRSTLQKCVIVNRLYHNAESARSNINLISFVVSIMSCVYACVICSHLLTFRSRFILIKLWWLPSLSQELWVWGRNTQSTTVYSHTHSYVGAIYLNQTMYWHVFGTVRRNQRNPGGHAQKLHPDTIYTKPFERNV